MFNVTVEETTDRAVHTAKGEQRPAHILRIQKQYQFSNTAQYTHTFLHICWGCFK